MSVNLIRWLHLSDFHVGKDDYGQRRLFKYILENVNAKVNAGEGPHLVFITGDVADKGSSDQYKLFYEEFLQALRRTVGHECAGRVYIVPGNHDVDRTKCKAVPTHGVLSRVPNFLDPTDNGLSERKVIFERFEAFATGDCGSADHWLLSPAGAFWQSVEINKRRIGILGINTAWLSCDSKADRNQLSAGKGIIETGLEELEKCDIRIVLGHHPIDWMLDDEVESVRSLLGKYRVLYLHGHLHKTKTRSDSGAGLPFQPIQSGAAFDAREDETWVNRFLWCSLDFDAGRILAEPLKWSRDWQRWIIDTDAFLPESKLPGEDIWEIPFPDRKIIQTVGSNRTLNTKPPLSLSESWFRSQVQTNIDNLGQRYDPQLNMPLDIASSFDGLARNDSYREFATYQFDIFFRALNRVTSSLSTSNLCHELVQRMEDERLRLEKCYLQSQNLELAHIDIDQMIQSNKEISDLLYRSHDVILSSTQNKQNQESHHLKERIFRALAALREFHEFTRSPVLAASNIPVILLTGDAGAGKSHLLADVARKNIDSAKASVLLLGQHFASEEAPWTQILHNLLRLNCNESELLEALNDKAQAQGCRLLFMIDAINEGKGRFFWPDNLKGFVKSFSQYPWLGLVLSVRTSYVNLLTPEDLIPKDLAVRIQHHGFRDIEYEASSFFFQQYGIEQPSVPLLRSEFGNPLFLKIFCEGLKRAGSTRIPRGHNGITRIIEFFLENIEKKLSRPSEFDYPQGRNLVRRTVNRIIEAKLKSNDSFIAYEEAYIIADEELCKFSTKKHFLDALISEGVFSKDLFWRNNNTQEEGIYLAYERFEDQLTVSFLLDNDFEQGNPERAFQEGGKLQGYIDEYYARQGLLESFSIQIPERIGKEFHELLPEQFKSHLAIADAFVYSLIWRGPETITETTFDIINNIIFQDDRTYDSFFEMVYSVALDPEHRFNADLLHDYLMPFSLADRDSIWTIFLHTKSQKGNAIRRLIDWALSDGQKPYLSDESRLLAGKALAWLFSSTDIALRNSATKGLATLFKENISLLKQLMEAFDDVNDPYVLERILAAGYGAVLLSKNLDGLDGLSSYILKTVFMKETVYPNVLVRDYARNIIEYAIHRDKFELEEASVIRPPYRSSFPDQFPTIEEIDRKYEFDYKAESFKDHYWSQNSILRSMTTEYGRGTSNYGDFGRYTFQSRLRGWDRFDPQDLSNYACEMVFQTYGYDVEKHGRFDRDISNASRHWNETERIGKKYQWMALYEVLARISDNHKMRDDSGGWGTDRRYIWYQGTWEPSVRNIDPTFMPSGLSAIYETSPTSDAYHWVDFTYDSWDEDAANWVVKSDDLPEPNKLIVKSDNLGEAWLVMESHLNWEESTPVGVDKYDFPRRHLWYQIRSYLVRENEAEKVILWTKKQHFIGRSFPEAETRNRVFSREFYWSPAYQSFNNPDHSANGWRDLREQEYEGPLVGNIMPTTESYGWESEMGYKESYSYLSPNEFIYRFMDLGFSDNPGEWINSQGELVCFDPSVRCGEPSCLVIKKNVLLEFLEYHNLRLFWTLLGQKNVHGLKDGYLQNWLEFSGTFVLQGQEVIGDVRKSIEGWRAR